MSDKVYFTYNDIHKVVKNSIPAIKAFNPEIILAIGGGGFIPGRMVRTFIGVDMIACVLKVYDDETYMAEKEPIKVQWLDENAIKALTGKRVLIVDEVDDTRTTLAYCVKEVMKLPVAQVGVFVVHNKIKKKLGSIPDGVHYIAGDEFPDLWIVYSWEAKDIEEHNRLAEENEALQKYLVVS